MTDMQRVMIDLLITLAAMVVIGYVWARLGLMYDDYQAKKKAKATKEFKELGRKNLTD